MTIPAMEAHRISRRFGRLQALDAVDLTLEQGAFVALLGPAGAGKTTLLRIIAGLEVPDQGRIRIRGREATADAPKDRDIAMIFDSLALYPNKTGYENIAHPLQVRGLGREATRAAVAMVAETLKINRILDRMPRTMSGGERQRIALGRALVRNPAFFLLDEPLSSLDAQLRVGLRTELRRLQRERDASIVYATPDHAEAMAVADQVAVLLQGRIRQVAAPQVIYDRPVDRDVARFVGAPEINIVPADYRPEEGGIVRLAGMVQRAAAAHATIFNGAAASFEAGLRPEHVLVAPAEAATGANGRVVDTEPLGLRAAITVDTAGGQLRAVMPQQQALRLGIGAPVAVSFMIERSLCFDAADGQRLG